jgi:hypothetical protein
MALQRSRVVHALDGAAREQDIDLLDPLSASFFSSRPPATAVQPLQREISDSSQHQLQQQPLSMQARPSSAQSPGPRLSFTPASPKLSSPAVSLQRVASSDDPLADLITLPLSPERFEAPAAAAAAASPAFSSPLAIELDEGISAQPPAFISQQEPLSPVSDEQLHTSVSPARSAAAAAAVFTAAQRLTGEETVMNLKNTALHAPNGRAYPGELIMTTYQLVFIPREGAAGGGFAHGFGHLKGAYFRVPLSSIDRIERERKSSARGAPPDLGVSISVYTKVSCLLLYRHCVQCVQSCYDSGHYMQCTS